MLQCIDLFLLFYTNDFTFVYPEMTRWWFYYHQYSLENHCTRTTQSSRAGCSRRVYRIVYVAVKKGNILVNILLLEIFFANYSLMNPEFCPMNDNQDDCQYALRLWSVCTCGHSNLVFSNRFLPNNFYQTLAGVCIQVLSYER